MLLDMFSVSPHFISLYFTAVITFSESHLTVDKIYLYDARKCFGVIASPHPSIYPSLVFYLNLSFTLFVSFCFRLDVIFRHQESVVTAGSPAVFAHIAGISGKRNTLEHTAKMIPNCRFRHTI
ncbi:hypothetical protein AMECASPLE_014155 [Ameca splendens]|uniref:Uncharacterized protein n=1 Tax=Ameca splendens TaxID=208324 RepID=A0ABV0ZAE2_9TELE